MTSMLLRPPRRDEAEAVLALHVARDLADIGRPDVRPEDVVSDWDEPAIDIERDVFVVEDNGAIVGWADTDPRGGRVAVHPEHEGRGIGTLLRSAVESRMRERGFAVLQHVVSTNDAAIRHLRAAGYRPTRVEQRMRGVLARAPAAPAAGVRHFDLATEGRAVHALRVEAFAEIEGDAPVPYDVWKARRLLYCEPAFLLAVDDDEGLAAFAIGERWEDGVGYVAQLGVALRARGRGLGRTMLLALFGAFRDAGLTVAELSVAGTNAPATRLYESCGMARDFQSQTWELA